MYCWALIVTSLRMVDGSWLMVNAKIREIVLVVELGR